MSPYFAWGIYLDDNSGGVDVIGNIVARCGRASLHMHDARDCILDNNVFVEAGLRQWEWDGWTTDRHFWKENFPGMVKGYESVVNEPAWQKMRGMEMHPKDAPDAEGRVMRWGGSVGFLDGDIKDDKGRTLVHATSTIKIVRPRRQSS